MIKVRDHRTLDQTCVFEVGRRWEHPVCISNHSLALVIAWRRDLWRDLWQDVFCFDWLRMSHRITSFSSTSLGVVVRLIRDPFPFDWSTCVTALALLALVLPLATLFPRFAKLEIPPLHGTHGLSAMDHWRWRWDC